MAALFSVYRYDPAGNAGAGTLVTAVPGNADLLVPLGIDGPSMGLADTNIGSKRKRIQEQLVIDAFTNPVNYHTAKTARKNEIRAAAGAAYASMYKRYMDFGFSESESKAAAKHYGTLIESHLTKLMNSVYPSGDMKKEY